MHLEEIKKEIGKLARIMGFRDKPEDIPKRLFFAFIELCEASNA